MIPLLGPGLRWRPAYDGSASQRTESGPVVRYFGQPWFARSTQGVLEGGVRMELAPGLHAGAQLAYEPGRKPSESDFLKSHNVPGVNRGASVGLHFEWDHKFGPMPITLLARARQHTDSDRGAQADLRLQRRCLPKRTCRRGRIYAGDVGEREVDRLFLRHYAAAVRRHGLAGVRCRKRIVVWQPGLLWSVDLTRNWIVVGSMEARRLQGDAARSPLTERTSNYYVSAGIAYHF